MTNASTMITKNWPIFFLLPCCAHRDDGDSLGNDDVLVHPLFKNQENQSTNQTTHNNKNPPPKKQTKQKTNQNTCNPKKGETVRQSWLSVSEENPGSQNISSDKKSPVYSDVVLSTRYRKHSKRYVLVLAWGTSFLLLLVALPSCVRQYLWPVCTWCPWQSHLCRRPGVCG